MLFGEFDIVPEDRVLYFFYVLIPLPTYAKEI